MNKEIHRIKMEALVGYGFYPDFCASRTDKLYDIFIPENLSPKAKTEAIKYALDQLRSQAEKDLPEKAIIVGAEARLGRPKRKKRILTKQIMNHATPNCLKT